MNTDLNTWQNAIFNSDTDLTPFIVEPFVTINGQPVLRPHFATYLTGKESCRAHHFAKHLAVKVLTGDGGPQSVAATSRKVLWIDTLHGPQRCAQLYGELSRRAACPDDFQLACLDLLGTRRDDAYAVIREIEGLITDLDPSLVIIDDIDHLMPFCGLQVAIDFCRFVRRTLNNCETAFLFIGYNHLGKKAGTTGNIGKYLFPLVDDVFSLSTQHEVTTVRLARSLDFSRNPDDTEFRFTIGDDNLPREADRDAASARIVDDDTLRDIIHDILRPGDTITPDELLRQVLARQRQLKRHTRAVGLITQALRLNLLQDASTSSGEDSGGSTKCPYYTLSVSGLENDVNNKLTLPTLPPVNQET